MYSITSEHFLSAFLMTAGMVALIVLVVGSVIYALYRFFKEEDSEK